MHLVWAEYLCPSKALVLEHNTQYDNIKKLSSILMCVSNELRKVHWVFLYCCYVWTQQKTPSLQYKFSVDSGPMALDVDHDQQISIAYTLPSTVKQKGTTC